MGFKRRALGPRRVAHTLILTPDTNILVEVFDSRDPERQAIAKEIFTALCDRRGDKIAHQVLGELYSVLTRKLKQERSIAKEAVEALVTIFEPFNYQIEDVHTALFFSENGVLSYWDGLLVSAAQNASCDYLISEDMHTAFSYHDLEVITPFEGAKINPRLVELLAT